ncbi:MAG: Maf family protein [Patescibacteria group bacterium]|nr:Maf family protein [Patescibacteria group bacterium]
MNIILGSSSKFRKAAFAKVTPKFETMSPEIDEKAIRDSDPQALTLKIARAKAAALLSLIADEAILVTADQVVVINGEIREKPDDEDECRRFLRSYNDQPIEVVNGVVVTNTKTNARAEGNQVTHIQFRQIPETVIDKLIQEGHVLSCSGGLKAEHSDMQSYIESIDGTADDLQGVPVELIKRLMTQI